jgi:hypothetical protein
MKNQIYEGIKNNTYSIQELNDIFENLLPIDFRKEFGVNLFYVNALLLHFYNNTQGYDNREELITKNADGNFICLFKSKFEKDLKPWQDLARCLNDIDGRYHFNDAGLNFLLNKIDLTKAIKK